MKILLAILLLAAALHAQAAAPNAEEAALLQVDRGRAEAERKQDAATLRDLLDDQFFFTGASGNLHDKASFIADILKTTIVSYQITGDSAHVYGDTGVVTSSYTGHLSIHGKEVTTSYRIMAVYARRNGRWRAVAEQFIQLPPA